jgi:hypothetical protein
MRNDFFQTGKSCRSAASSLSAIRNGGVLM